jgi:hypothetical protein
VGFAACSPLRICSLGNTPAKRILCSHRNPALNEAHCQSKNCSWLSGHSCALPPGRLGRTAEASGAQESVCDEQPRSEAEKKGLRCCVKESQALFKRRRQGGVHCAGSQHHLLLDAPLPPSPFRSGALFYLFSKALTSPTGGVQLMGRSVPCFGRDATSRRPALLQLATIQAENSLSTPCGSPTHKYHKLTYCIVYKRRHPNLPQVVGFGRRHKIGHRRPGDSSVR